MKTTLVLQLRRLAAFFYDLMVMLGLIIVAGFLYLGAQMLILGTDVVEPGNLLFRLYLCLIIFGYVYISWRRAGQTIGMKAWRLRAVSTDGSQLTFRQILSRFLVGILTFGFFGLGYLWSFLDSSGRTLPEILSNTQTQSVTKISNP
ncbi:RDD family protein [Salinispirillum sp. LH 10-3-1]|uniref:RDD family protein n=1 Tax=Salinispirillum sp. LH 10-3-1 TaxID=2952525 RepID=A0AB38YDD9_9GAMM